LRCGRRRDKQASRNWLRQAGRQTLRRDAWDAKCYIEGRQDSSRRKAIIGSCKTLEFVRFLFLFSEIMIPRGVLFLTR
jgi:hypothetical protein